MKKNKLLVLFTFSILTVLFSTSISQAASGWTLPVNNFNLPDNIDTGIKNLTNWLLWLVTALSVIAIIWGGINYIFSSGDTTKAELSKGIIYYALIGLFVAGFAYALMHIVTTVILK